MDAIAARPAAPPELRLPATPEMPRLLTLEMGRELLFVHLFGPKPDFASFACVNARIESAALYPRSTPGGSEPCLFLDSTKKQDVSTPLRALRSTGTAANE